MKQIKINFITKIVQNSQKGNILYLNLKKYFKLKMQIKGKNISYIINIWEYKFQHSWERNKKELKYQP